MRAIEWYRDRRMLQVGINVGPVGVVLTWPLLRCCWQGTLPWLWLYWDERTVWLRVGPLGMWVRRGP